MKDFFRSPISTLRSALQYYFRSESFGSWVFVWFYLRVAVGILHSLAPVTSPHIWRQVDTMGVALRYLRRWTVEDGSSGYWLPGVLNSGDGTGLHVMELPLLNVAAAPLFYFGVDLGRTLVQLFLLGIILLLTWGNYRVWTRIGEMRTTDSSFEALAGGFSWMALLMPVFSMAAPYTNKFIPDLAANCLVLLGAGSLWLARRWLALILVAVGLLIKPTAVIALAVLLLHPSALLQLRRWWYVLAAAIAPSVLYYTLGAHWLRQFETDGPLFAIHHVNPLRGFVDFWTKAGPFEMMHYHGFGPFAWIPLVILLWPAVRVNPMIRTTALKLFALVCLTFSVIGSLSGDHSAMHSYYLLGATPFFALFAYLCWQTHGSWIWRAAFVLLVSTRLLELSGLEMQGFFKKDAPAQLFASCAKLRASHPELPWQSGFVFRAPVEQFPLLGLCFGERQGASQSQWGFTYAGQMLDGCEAIDGSGNIVLLACSSKP